MFELPVVQREPQSSESSSLCGKIPQCQQQGCGFVCCEFAEGNFIALYPGELDAAADAGLSLDHLRYHSDGAGGHHAVCKAGDRSICDGGYKPLDCRSYPFFPTVNDTGKVTATLKGKKCPLQPSEISRHQDWVLSQWTRLVGCVVGLIPWVRSTKLVGYESVESD